MSAPRKGRDAENRCIRDLLRPVEAGGLGFHGAMRTAGSRNLRIAGIPDEEQGGPIDVVAFRMIPAQISDNGQDCCDPTLVCVRSGTNPHHSPEERQRAVAIGKRLAMPVMEWLLRTRGRGRKSLVTWRRIEAE